MLLLDKKLTSMKECKLCPTKLSILHPYPYCDKCYKSKIRSSYNNWYDDDDDDY